MLTQPITAGDTVSTFTGVRPALWVRRLLRTYFAAEWLGIFVIAMVATVWAWQERFDLSVRWSDISLSATAVLAILVARAIASERASLVTEYFLLTVVSTVVFGVISYLSMTTGRPLADAFLMAADRAVGFEWLANYRWLTHHSLAAMVLQFAYNSLVYQGLYFGVLFGIMGKRQQLREMFWLVLVAGIFTSAGAALFPALGPFKAFGVKSEFLAVVEQLRSGNLHFALDKLTGVVSFPSFHTTMALLYIYGFSRAGSIGWAAAVLNVVMLPAIPFFGGHYLVDMAAGAMVAIGSLGIVRLWPVLWIPAVRQRGLIAACARSPASL